MLRHEVKIPYDGNYVWVACEILGMDETDYVIQYKDLSGIFFEELKPQNLIREVNVEIPDEIMIEAAWLAANHIKDYLIFANSQDIETIAYEVFSSIDKSLNYSFDKK